MSNLTTTYRSNFINRLNPKHFEKYEEYKELLLNKIFLYSEIHPKEDEIIKVNSDEYIVAINFPIEIRKVGNLTNPKRSLRQILTAYKCKEFLTTEYDGCLFVYDGFKSSPEVFKISESAVLLKFQVYKLKKIQIK